jgi:hypothetical protein
VYLLYRVDHVAAAKAALNQLLPHVASAADWESRRLAGHANDPQYRIHGLPPCPPMFGVPADS